MSAVISPCGKYRYHLSRPLDGYGSKIVTFIMLNPSTADAETDDATIRKLKGFCQRLGYGYLNVVNLFAFRATDPKDLKKASDPMGPENMAYISMVTQQSDDVICAWGTHGIYGRQNEKVLEIMKDIDLHALEITKDGHPKHPLYISYDKQPILFRSAQS